MLPFNSDPHETPTALALTRQCSSLLAVNTPSQDWMFDLVPHWKFKLLQNWEALWIKATAKWQCVVRYLHWRLEEQPVYCIFTAWKFHVFRNWRGFHSLPHSTSWQLQPLTADRTCCHLNMLHLCACFLPVVRRVSMHVLHVCMFDDGDGACLDRDLIPPQRQLCQSERQRAGTSRRRERRGEKDEFDSRQQMPN